MDTKNLQNRFKYHELDAIKVQKMENIRKNFLWMAEFINEMCPDGREKSLAITQLEEAQFWTNAAIARDNADTK